MTDPQEPVSSLAASLDGSGAQVIEVARGLARRDASSVSQFYERHVDGLYALVMTRVRGDSALAEDIVQETFLEAIHRAEAYDPSRGSLRAWLWTLSRNVLRKHLRHHPRGQDLIARQLRLDQSWAELAGVLDGARSSDEILLRQETRELVTATLASLEPRYRQVLERKYIDGCSLSVLAEELAVSQDAAKSLTARGRRAFRELFDEIAERARADRPATAKPERR